ncbi:MAG TPA: hypothetical protein PL155_04820 [Candidatus Omnitrophota bacterium]|nr:hypothetical protein [Candidatus Omnitrophota bacterium]HPD84199.1 hypothetical protein [Candidatus Omnitrophota bacterium]HRZ03055.1 hypothetical protein [Candidatus Omnitrophota bacterium]
MKKCIKCQIIFYTASRIRCLYCDSQLESASMEEVMQLGSETTNRGKMSRIQESISHQRSQYLVSSFFRARSFSFVYAFSRNQLKMGKQFKRFLVQPLDLTFFIKIPWVLIDLIDSILFHVVYTGFCPQCGWKHKKMTAQGDHTSDDCVYNKEYSAVVNEIFSGEIVRNEEEFERRAGEIIKQGKRSAYHDLCSRKRDFESFIDVITILISMGLLIYLVVRTILPIFGSIYDF